MIVEEIDLRHLIASPGKVLTDGEQYVHEVFLAPSASMQDWDEIDEGDVPDDAEVLDEPEIEEDEVEE